MFRETIVAPGNGSIGQDVASAFGENNIRRKKNLE